MKGEVKERGMIFNDEMVRAILGGNKTQTRRIVEEKFYGRAVPQSCLPSIVHMVNRAIVFGFAKPTGYMAKRRTSQRWFIAQACVTPGQNKRTGFRSRFVINQYQKSGRHQFTCRAGHRAFFWKLPTCAWNGCVT